MSTDTEPQEEVEGTAPDLDDDMRRALEAGVLSIDLEGMPLKVVQVGDDRSIVVGPVLVQFVLPVSDPKAAWLNEQLARRPKVAIARAMPAAPPAHAIPRGRRRR